MTGPADQPDQRRSPAPLVAGIAAALFCVTVVGGYKLDWTWTGYSDNDTLWDWLGLFVLPVVIALVPIWYRTHTRLRVEWIGLAAVVLTGWAVSLVGGYWLGWEWTGFDGRTLWDWLELLVLPAVLVVLPILLTDARHDRRWHIGLALLAVLFAGCALGGYLLGWAWTGFEGNTFWDWLHLFLVPFVLPAALIWLTVDTRRG